VTRRLLAWLMVWCLGGLTFPVDAQTIRGVGSNFPVLLYGAWARVYEKQTGVRLEYVAAGGRGSSSAAALQAFDKGEAAFITLNRPLSEKRVLEGHLVQFPVVMGGTVPVVNIAGIQPGQLRLSGPVLADIFLGKIVRWSDPAIRELNPSLFLPATPITVISRGDPSGTTSLLDQFLSSVSPGWKAFMQPLPFVKVPVGPRPVGLEDLVRTLFRIPGSISYVDYAFARRTRLAHVNMLNAAGNFVAPTYVSIQSAALGGLWVGAMSRVTTNAAHPNAWPIASPSFGVLRFNHKTSDQVANALHALEFHEWALMQGDQIADDNDFVPLPAEVKTQVEVAVVRRLAELGAASK